MPVIFTTACVVDLTCLTPEDAWRLITLCCKVAMKWSDWSDTRWLRAGDSARRYCRSLLLGADKLVDSVLSDDACYHQWLRLHAEKSSDAVRQFFIVALSSSWVAGVIHADIMSDDRLLRFGAHYQAKVPKLLDDIAVLPEMVWQRLAGILAVPVPWEELRSWSQLSAARCAGFLEREVFGFLHEYPWRLTQQNIGWNLDVLKQMRLDEVADETCRKIHMLMSLGYDESRINSALDLLRDAACTVNVVEQAHGSGAIMRKAHSTGAASLADRAGVHRVRHVFAKSPLEAKLDRLQAKLDRLARYRPERVSGRQMLFSLRYTRSRNDSLRGSAEVARARGVLCASHHVYDRLDAKTQMRLDRKAR